MKGLSLSEKLSALTNPQPSLNVEEAEDEVTGAKLDDKLEDGEEDEEFGEQSKLRVRTSRGLEGDERYRGKKGKRRKLDQDQDTEEHNGAELGHMFDFGSEDEEESANDESEGMSDEEKDFKFDSNTDFASYGDDESNEGSEETDEDDEEDSEGEMEDDVEASDVVKTEEIVTFPASDVDHHTKGCAVRDQIGTWDKLLEQRILLQKMLTKVNTFPSNLEQFVDSSDTECQSRLKKTEKVLKTLMMKYGDLRENLERKSLEESFSIEAPGPKCKLNEVSSWLENIHEGKETSRRESLAYWGDRTRKLGAAWDSLHTEPLEQVDQILSNRVRLVARTRVKRNDMKILGAGPTEEEQENNANIFDDSDFYHHLLRELIERKTNSSSGDASGQQWLQIQKLRSKMKRKIDTKASKGRKIRYDVHAKLVNFMAPIYIKESMEENARSELFSSLFGSRNPS